MPLLAASAPASPLFTSILGKEIPHQPAGADLIACASDDPFGEMFPSRPGMACTFKRVQDDVGVLAVGIMRGSGQEIGVSTFLALVLACRFGDPTRDTR